MSLVIIQGGVKMKLGELKPAVEKKNRKRVGRGISSGNGKTAGRGRRI